MLTYVINTSENKTFDSDRLFDLAGYNRIRWMNCSLRDIESCEKEIYEKQNALGADSFRVVVLVDFFGFYLIRPPYGRGERGFGLTEEGVEFAVYLPYIEAYLIDKLFNPLAKRDIYISSCEVYYIQNGEYERFESLDNREHQVAKILSGKKGTEVQMPEQSEDVMESFEVIRTEGFKEQPLPDSWDETDEPENGVVKKKITQAQHDRLMEELLNRPDQGRDKTAYTSFELKCTKNVTLEFQIKDYPYGAMYGNAMDFHTFFEAFRRRAAHATSVRRHYYVTQYGESPVRAAFDTLSLSLYLIRAYEREDDIGADGEELKIATIEPSTLREVLERSWNKVHDARNLARSNTMQYYELDQMGAQAQSASADLPDLPDDVIIGRLRAELGIQVEEETKRYEAVDLYHKICDFADRTGEQIERDNISRHDEIMGAYLKKRDATNEDSIAAEFEELRRAGVLKRTDQCPSRVKYDNLIKLRENDISELFDSALKADLIEVDYQDERRSAKSWLKTYNKAKACMQRNWIGEGVFWLLTMLAMLIPYHYLQLRNYTVLSFTASQLYLWSATIFTGLFLLATMIQTVPLMRRMKMAMSWLRHLYKTCLAKNEYAFSKLKHRYEHDLIRIEELRYELRQIEQLYEANIALEQNVTHHREMLEEVEDQLSAMLNNLGVEPVYQPEERVDKEFDLTKPFHARENSIYKVFSIETIEAMFSKKKKGSDEQ